MKQEQRLLVAFILIAAILGIWSTLMPPERLPINQPPVVGTETKPALLVGKPVEKTEEFTLGRFTLGIGESGSGIGMLKLDQEILLEHATPGLMEIRSGPVNPEPVPLQSRLEAGGLFSEGLLGTEGLRVLRWIRPEEGSHRLQCRIKVINTSSKPKKADLQVIVYRPLHAPVVSGKPSETGASLHLAGKTSSISVGKGQQKRFDGTPDWVASQGKSHVVIVQMTGKEGMFHVEHPAASGSIGVLDLSNQEIPAGGEKEWEFPLYAGPMSLVDLRKAGLEEALSFGAFSGVSRMLLGFLGWSYNLLHNYGLAICLLSLAVWVPFSPLTWYSRWISAQTMKKMAAVKPQEARLRQEHKNNPDQMHRELMQLYKKHGVNPASGCIGCLPLLFTMPIYIALFQVLTRAPELRGAEFLWIKDLAAPDGMMPLPFEIPFIGNRLNILPIVATVATYFQQAGMQPPVGEMSEEQKAQQGMMKIFPLVFMVLFYGLPSGFMLYWVINSVLTVAQQFAADRIAKARA
ncbi:MAG: YidC/Oxa1 family insertase periplasmic-domain containing protein [Candidatus Omnitrophota bacterium]|nr:YidC/Oxa1 family insertase periplasmic-domain containing protein [Candidatus Omnitrophota bacterium]